MFNDFQSLLLRFYVFLVSLSEKEENVEIDVDEVEEVLENGEVMDLVEAEDLVRRREAEARLPARVLVPRPGDQGPDMADMAGWCCTWWC